MATHLSDWPVEELPCVRVDMSLLLIMAEQFCPGYSSSIFSQATPYFSISISSPVQALSANLLQTFSQTRESERGAERMREGEQRRGTAGLSVQSCFLFPKVWEMQIQREEKKKKSLPEDDVVLKISVLWTAYSHGGKRRLPASTHSPMCVCVSST